MATERKPARAGKPALNAVAGLGAALCLALAGPASGQSAATEQPDITVDALDAPRAFAPGIALDNALDAESWRGTSADRALRLMEEMPLRSDHPVVRDMLRRVVLSGLVPPAGADGAGTDSVGTDGRAAAFDRLRVAAAQALATPDEYARFETRNPAARDPRLRADARLARGDLPGACDMSDAVQRGRGETYWVRLRAACHELRGETSAADLARDILRDRGEPIALVVPDPPDGFWARVMGMDDAELDAWMTELAGEPEPPTSPPEAPPTDAPVDEPDELGGVIDGTQEGALEAALESSRELSIGVTGQDDPFDPLPLFADPPPAFDLDAALADASDQGTARLYVLGREGRAAAVAAFAARAAQGGVDPNAVLPRVPAVLDPADMARADLPLFARYAAVRRDVTLMRALFDAIGPQGDGVEVPDDEVLRRTAVRERLALASDALGGGFYGRALGEGLEEALRAGSPGARTDALIALGLGSNFSEEVETLLKGAAETDVQPVRWIALDHAADRGAQAETLLRVASLMSERDAPDALALYRALRALRKAGLSDTAGQLAAHAFLRTLSS
ncbi:MAG: hypothetical protein AAF311_04995 [Pseudomonadota bacterium]